MKLKRRILSHRFLVGLGFPAPSHLMTKACLCFDRLYSPGQELWMIACERDSS